MTEPYTPGSNEWWTVRRVANGDATRPWYELSDEDRASLAQSRTLEEPESAAGLAATGARDRIHFDGDDLDEVVLFGLAHLERMNDGAYFLSLTGPSGSGYGIWLNAEKRCRLSSHWEKRHGPPLNRFDPTPPARSEAEPVQPQDTHDLRATNTLQGAQGDPCGLRPHPDVEGSRGEMAAIRRLTGFCRNAHPAAGDVSAFTLKPDIEALLAALSASPASPTVGGWRDIASAPTWDPVLVVDARGQRKVAFRHHPSSRTDEFLSVPGRWQVDAVAWMPLPALAERDAPPVSVTGRASTEPEGRSEQNNPGEP